MVPLIPSRFLVSRCTLDTAQSVPFRLRGFHPPAGFPKTFLLESLILNAVRTGARTPVWPLSISLAATLEIDKFSFSSSPLDVSVQAVPFHTLWIGVWMHEGVLMRVSPFRHLRISGYLLLPAAFRSLSRLSSALSAKASTLRSFLLDLSFTISIAFEMGSAF